MGLSPRLEVRQNQQLVMTPQLQQAIRLLQLSNLDLAAFVEGELERNPLLERAESDDGPLVEGERAQPAPPADSEGAQTGGDEGWLDLQTQSAKAGDELDAEPTCIFPDATPVDLQPPPPGSGWKSTRQTSGPGEGGGDLEDFVAWQPSLRDHLLDQLPFVCTTPADHLIGQYLVDQVDDAGYLIGDLDMAAARLGATPGHVEEILSRLQGFDPTGVFARTLAECLALQLRERNRYDPQIALLLDHLDLVATHNLQLLRRIIKVPMGEIVDMIAEIRQLNPKPGLKFGALQVQTVIPDVIVQGAADGTWHVELNADTLPRVLVSRNYYARVAKKTHSSEEKSYLLDCLQTANWLVKCLDQRARTILRVAGEIVRQQDAFLTHGVQHLRPLNLRMIAEAISMHESTVSRVTSNKYMATPRGIFELKYFFTSSICASGTGDAFSSEAVRHWIRQMIDAETSQAILSDDMIVERLRAKGIDIARRTVAKYRDAMRIPSSAQRRREKRLGDYAAPGGRRVTPPGPGNRQDNSPIARAID